MKNIIWKDISTFSKNDKEKISYCFSCEIADLRTVIVYNHIHHPKKWIMNCYKISIDEVELSAKNLEEAKTESIKIIYHTLTWWLENLNK